MAPEWKDRFSFLLDKVDHRTALLFREKVFVFRGAQRDDDGRACVTGILM